MPPRFALLALFGCDLYCRNRPCPPAEPCTPARAGEHICPAGPGSGYGYACTASGWQLFMDGPARWFRMRA